MDKDDVLEFVSDYRDYIMGFVVVVAVIICVFRIAACNEYQHEVSQKEYWQRFDERHNR